MGHPAYGTDANAEKLYNQLRHKETTNVILEVSRAYYFEGTNYDALDLNEKGLLLFGSYVY